MKLIKWQHWKMSTKKFLVFWFMISMFLLGVSLFLNVLAYSPHEINKRRKVEITNILLEINPKQDPLIADLIAGTILEACETYDQDPWLVVAIIRKESRCKRYATNPDSGAKCLMQLLLNEKEIAQLGLKGSHKLYNIKECVHHGVQWLYNKYQIDGTTETALLAYGGWITKEGSGYIADIMCFRYDLLRGK